MKIKTILSSIFISLFIQSQSQTVYIKAGQVFDGQRFLGSKIIEIGNGRIADIFDTDYYIPDKAKFIDASNSTLLPGFIDSHIHFMASPLPYIDEIEKNSFGRLASEGISLFPEHRKHLLMNGITTIVDMGSPLISYLRFKKALDEGKIIGPEIYFPGPLFTAPDGHPAGTTYTGQHDLIENGTVQVNNATIAGKKVDDLSKQGVSFIKIVYDSMWYRAGGAPRLDLNVAKVIIHEAHKLNLKVYAHVGSEPEALDMIRAGVDGIEHGFTSTSDTVFEEMTKRNLIFTPTISAYVHYAPKAVPFMQKTIQRASDLNVLIAMGTDFPASYGKNCGDDIFVEMNMLEDAGMSRTDVLKASTCTGAKKIGKENEIGSIAKGFKANLILYKGKIDSGILTPGRIEKVLLHGDVVIENGELPVRFTQKFRSKSFMIFPYGYPDLVTKFSVGMSVTEFNLLNTGTSMYADVAYSIRNMWSANIQLFIPSPVKMTTLYAGFHFDNVNRLFYGTGNNSLNSLETEYAATSFKGGISATTNWTKKLKLTYSIIFDQFKIRSDENVLPDTLPGSSGGHQTILGVSLAWDSRDHQNNPWKGIYLAVSPEVSPSFLSTDNFQRISLDVRSYISPFHKHIIASRILYRQAFGEVPYYYMPDFGGSFIGRGYYFSRFIDRSGLYGQVEYRYPVWRILSGVAFADIGQVQNRAGLFKFNDFHYTFGFGPRFSFGSNENSIFGLDAGFTHEGMMIVFHTGHAF
jgi:imidazolonepropionase-like amidohydrolase